MLSPDLNDTVVQFCGVPAETEIRRLAAEHGIDQFTGPAGSALWFDANLLHGSADNSTPFLRSNVFVVFDSVENTLAEPFAASARRREYVAERDFTPLRRNHRGTIVAEGDVHTGSPSPPCGVTRRATDVTFTGWNTGGGRTLYRV